MIRTRNADALRRAATAGVCSARLLSTSHAARKDFRHLPSFAKIKSVNLDSYIAEEQTSQDQMLGKLREAVNMSEESKGHGLIKSFLYGSPAIKEEQANIEQSFSTQLMRGKYVHELVTHRVIPARAADYLDLIKVYPKIANDPRNQVHLVGSWRHVIGDMDTYTHIWEYKGFPGFHHTQNVIHEDPEYLQYLQDLRDTLRSRESQMMQEFQFWGGTAAPHDLGGIFELRTYDLQPGKLLEWEQHWKKGIEYRRKVMEPVGAWFSQIGPLNRVHHLWQFYDLEHRKLSRKKSWEIPGWAETTHETVKLINTMQSNILVPLPFSPLK